MAAAAGGMGEAPWGLGSLEGVWGGGAWGGEGEHTQARGGAMKLVAASSFQLTDVLVWVVVDIHVVGSKPGVWSKGGAASVTW